MELDPFTLGRAQRGDRVAQDAFLRRYARPLHSVIQRAGPARDADDLTQELLGKLLAVLPRLEPRGPATLTTWVFTVAHRWLLDQRKQRHLTLAPLEQGLHVADERPPADAQVATGQLRAALERAITTLPEAQRRVFVLAQVHGRPLEESAQGEGVPVGTIKSRLHRARAALTLRLGAQLDVPQGATVPSIDELERLSRFDAGELPAEEHAAVEAELRQRAELQTALAQLRALGVAAAALPPTLDEAAMTTLIHGVPRVAAPARAGSRWPAGVAVVAVVVGALFGRLFVTPAPRGPMLTVVTGPVEVNAETPLTGGATRTLKVGDTLRTPQGSATVWAGDERWLVPSFSELVWGDRPSCSRARCWCKATTPACPWRAASSSSPVTSCCRWNPAEGLARVTALLAHTSNGGADAARLNEVGGIRNGDGRHWRGGHRLRARWRGSGAWPGRFDRATSTRRPVERAAEPGARFCSPCSGGREEPAGTGAGDERRRRDRARRGRSAAK